MSAWKNQNQGNTFIFTGWLMTLMALKKFKCQYGDSYQLKYQGMLSALKANLNDLLLGG